MHPDPIPSCSNGYAPTENGGLANITPIEFSIVMKCVKPEQQNIVCRLASGQEGYRNQIMTLREDLHYDITCGQQPELGVSGCSDTRFNANTLFAIERVGRILKLKSPGGCIVWGKKPTQEALLFLDLLAKYGVPDLIVGQHYGCGGMNMIRSYHSMTGPYHGDKSFAAHVRRNLPAFAAFSRAQKVRYNEVMDLGLSSFEKRGLPLIGTRDEQIDQALAVRQAEVDYRFVLGYKEAAKKRRSDYTYPEPLGTYLHLGMQGRVFIYDGNKDIWAPIPLLNNEPVSASAPRPLFVPRHGCGCSVPSPAG